MSPLKGDVKFPNHRLQLNREAAAIGFSRLPLAGVVSSQILEKPWAVQPIYRGAQSSL